MEGSPAGSLRSLPPLYSNSSQTGLGADTPTRKEHEWLAEWAVAIFSTPLLLVKQQRNTGAYVAARIDSVTYPGKVATNQDRLKVGVEWDNRTFMSVELSRLGGTININGVDSTLMTFSLTDIALKSFEKRIVEFEIPLTGALLSQVDAVRQAGNGSVVIYLDVVASVTSSLNFNKPGKQASFRTPSFNAFYR